MLHCPSWLNINVRLCMAKRGHVVLHLLGLCFEDQTSSIACMTLHRKIFRGCLVGEKV